VYVDGALEAPTQAGSTVTIRNQVGDDVVSPAAVTVTGSIATYTVPSATLDAEDLSEGWILEWALVMSDVTHTFRNDGALVSARLYPSITDLDLFRRETALDPNSSDPMTDATDYQSYIDEADVEVQLRLIEQGNRPNLIVSPSALRGIWLNLTLAIIFDDLATRQYEAFAAKATEYRRRYEQAWNRCNFLYDSDDDGTPDSPDHRVGARPTTWLCSRGYR